MSGDPRPTTVELRFAVDATEAPLAYPDTAYPDTAYPEPVEDLVVVVAGPGVLATLILPINQARSWAGELFAAVAVAYQEATGDPHALTDLELASLPPGDGYDPGPGVVVVGDDDTPAGSGSMSRSTSPGTAWPPRSCAPASSSTSPNGSTSPTSRSPPGEPLAGRLA